MTRLLKLTRGRTPQRTNATDDESKLPWLDRPLSGWSCALGWLIALAIFVGLTTLFGGVTEFDALLSTYSSWFIAHGNFACAYPPGSSVEIALTAPLYTLISGGLSVLFGVGHGVTFPTQAALGSRCLTWLGPIRHWSSQTSALTPTLRFGYFGWLVLMVGVVAVLRASRRGKTGWEPLTLIFIACTPPVFMCLQYLFHPQDLLAMGLVLCGVASVQRDRWILAGVLMGLALTAQQFSILVLVALLVLAPNAGRIKMAAGTVVTWAIVVLPLVLVTSGRALRVALVGSGLGGSQDKSLTYELHITGSVVIDLWRLLPIVGSAGLAYWTSRKLGRAALEPVPLMALVATSLSLRLVFDEGLYGYYFMAVAVSLIVLDVLRRRFRIELIGWLALVVLVFDPLPWGFDQLTYGVSMWIWQLLLVTPAVGLSLAPLLAVIRSAKAETNPERAPAAS
jgi:hypothetical protein